MRYGCGLALIFAIFANAGLASPETKIAEAQSWGRENVNSRLNQERLLPKGRSYASAVLSVLDDYFDKYAHLAGLPAAELSDDELSAALEVFGGMASLGQRVARKSDHYPAVRETARATLAVFEAIRLRRKATLEETAYAYSAIFGLREWELESRLRENLGPMQSLPHIIDDPEIGSGRSLWSLDSDLFTMTRDAYELPEGLAWVVIAFSDCAVAKGAVSDIESDKELGRLFRGRSLWLTPPGRDALSFPAIFVWNARHPDFELKFIHHLDEWPMLNMRLDSPTFIRINRGKVVGVHSGWGTAEYLPMTREALLEIEARVPSKSR